MNTLDKILEYNRHPELSDWFMQQLEELIAFGAYHNQTPDVARNIISSLAKYKTLSGIENVVIGMSGGIDSALTASLFKAAGYTVNGVTMPIKQKPEETNRGVEACNALGLVHHHIDLNKVHDKYCDSHTEYDLSILSNPIRMGNIKARLRMITLYDLASRLKGFVASTDNFSELAAGFWTLHGDVGDVAPIQSLTKSWEVPAMAEYMGVPEATIKAVPTDGLGISNSDEDQFGFSYLEFDIVLLKMLKGSINQDNLSEKDQNIINNVATRIKNTAHKRANPQNIVHPIFQDRYHELENIDNTHLEM